MQGEKPWRKGLDDPWVQAILSDPHIAVHEEAGDWFLYRPDRILVHPVALDSEPGRVARDVLVSNGAVRVEPRKSVFGKREREEHRRGSSNGPLPLDVAAAAADAIGLELWSIPDESFVPDVVREARSHLATIASPVHVLFSDPHSMTGCGPADPAHPPTDIPGKAHADGRGLTIAVLDTGLDAKAHFGPNVPPEDHEVLDSAVAGTLDPAAGHGTFVAGLINRVVPGADLYIDRLLTGPGGVADEIDVALAISHLPKCVDLVNLSFGGPAMDDEPPIGIAQAIGRLDAHVVVVAAAGNDAEDRPHYPAAFKGVIAVGSVEDEALQWAHTDYTNYGWWVDACAPGSALQSAFVHFEETTATNPRTFKGGAEWSGTSFATPRVVAQIARHATQHGMSVAKAAYELIGDPGLSRIEDLGTLVVP